MSLHWVANGRIGENMHQGTITMNLPAFTDVDCLLPFDQIRKQVHQCDEIGQFLKNYDRLILTPSQGPWDSRQSNLQKLFVMDLPLLYQLYNTPSMLLFDLI
jgi:hypothetical protein